MQNGRRTVTDLEFGLTAQQRNGKVVHGVCLKGVVIPVAGLHDVVVGEPFQGGVGVLVDGGRVQGDRLVAGNVAPAFAFAGEQFRVEAPGDDRVDDDVVAAVCVVDLGDGEELPLTAAGSGSALCEF